MNFRQLVACIILSLCGLSAVAQDIPVIRANSRYVSIRDGLHYKKGNWHLSPEKNPDLYYVEIPRKDHRVSFLTGMDSISFDVRYGGEYDFIILLNNKDSCHTRIVARYRETVLCKSSLTAIPDTIPFWVGNNSKIYFKGSLNGSDPLDIQFDLGNSGAPIIKKSSIEKVSIRFDDSITLSNSDGTHLVPFSRSNQLAIGGISCDSVPVAVGDNMTWREDLIMGNYFFRDKIIEINYDKQVLILHDSLPFMEAGYSRHDMVLDNGVVPFLRATLLFRSNSKEGWFLFDSGAYTTILNNEDIAASNKMLTEFKKMFGADDKTRRPELSIGDYRFSGFNYTTQKTGNNGYIGLLGNDLMKRFNIILDNKEGILYLKPNSLAAAPYANPEFYAVRIGTPVLVLLIALVIFLIYRYRRRKQSAVRRRQSATNSL